MIYPRTVSALRRALVPLLLVAAFGGFLAHVRAFDFVTDDAYISFRYAENLARHGALEFNLGERVEGFTNFLWTVLLAGGIALRIPPELSSRVLGAGLGVLALLLTFLLARRSDRSPLALVAPALLATVPGFAAWSSGGLETALFCALGVLGLWLLLGDRLVAAGTVFALASMTRPEGAILFAAAALAELVRTRRLSWRFYLAFGAPFAAFYGWRLWYYGHPFPNTFYVKAGHWAFPRGLRYLAGFALQDGLIVAVPLLAWYRARDRRLALHSLVLLPVYLAYVASVGGDFMALHRFLVPLLPHMALVLHDALRGRPWLRFVAPALIAASAANAVRVDRATLASRGAVDGIDSIGYLKKFADDRILVGRWMREHLPPDTLVAVGGAGALPYASRLPALDSFGLCDEFIAHQVRGTGDRPGHTKVAPLSYLLRRKPDLVCFPQYEALAQHGYERTCIRTPGLDAPYCCLKRPGRKLGPL